jgi:hypothetical protein
MRASTTKVQVATATLAMLAAIQCLAMSVTKLAVKNPEKE